MQHDATKEIRNRLTTAGIDFSRLTWRDTEMLVEDAVLPLREEIERLRKIATFCLEALGDIAEPMTKIQADAKAEGAVVNGIMANELCKDANWLRDKARAAIREAATRRKEGRG